MTLFLKYRPQKIDDLDSEDIRNRLKTIFSSSYIPHAFLFAGPKGTGKTSTARIIAKILNCEKKDPNPCTKCLACKAIAEGRFLDVVEIDAASNRGIDEIRDLREKIKFLPVLGKVKVYIIDEVHMLTTEAFNALLKTLEEPPSHATFILATTEPDKLPETIRSRCSIFTFRKATPEELVHSLNRVVKGEDVTVSKEVVELIARSSDGSFRDGTKLLEQAISEDALTIEGVTKLIGRDIKSARHLLELILAKNTTEGLKEMSRLVEKGTSMRYLIEDILESLHTILLIQHGVLERSDLAKLSQTVSTPDVLSLIRLFGRAFVDQKTTSFPYLPVEVAIVEWCEEK
ncbi:DNA polymerase III subunit gamma/tau [Candidatus Gottesmanbacteria bacterium]|nr:DNA polymerase III subunit gamma/tau [Candidatus Gottesmanbacteria bacterium]